MFSWVAVKVEFSTSWFSISKFACIEFFRTKSTLNKFFIACLDVRNARSKESALRRVHIECENIICKQRFEWSKIIREFWIHETNNCDKSSIVYSIECWFIHFNFVFFFLLLFFYWVLALLFIFIIYFLSFGVWNPKLSDRPQLWPALSPATPNLFVALFRSLKRRL